MAGLHLAPFPETDRPSNDACGARAARGLPVGAATGFFEDVAVSVAAKLGGAGTARSAGTPGLHLEIKADKQFPRGRVGQLPGTRV